MQHLSIYFTRMLLLGLLFQVNNNSPASRYDENLTKDSNIFFASIYQHRHDEADTQYQEIFAKYPNEPIIRNDALRLAISVCHVSAVKFFIPRSSLLELKLALTLARTPNRFFGPPEKHKEIIKLVEEAIQTK